MKGWTVLLLSAAVNTFALPWFTVRALRVMQQRAACLCGQEL
jgi:hypothetical protein